MGHDMTIRYRVQLRCFHMSWFRKPVPKIGDTVYCHRCADYAVIMWRENPQKILSTL